MKMEKAAHVWVVERLDDLGQWYCINAYDLRRDAKRYIEWIVKGATARYRIRKYVRA